MPMPDLADLFVQVDSAQDGVTSDVKPRRRRSPTGQATTRLVLSAHVGNNADVFPQNIKAPCPHRIENRRRDLRKRVILAAGKGN